MTFFFLSAWENLSVKRVAVEVGKPVCCLLSFNIVWDCCECVVLK